MHFGVIGEIPVSYTHLDVYKRQEYAIPISKEVKNAKRNVPLGMMIGLFLIFIMQSVMVLGFHNYVEWGKLADSAAPHLLYGYAILGKFGKIWMMLVGALAVISTQNSTVNSLAVISVSYTHLDVYKRQVE